MRKLFIAFGLTLLSILTFVRAIDPLPVAEMRNTYFDLLQMVSPRQDADLPVHIVDIDEESLAKIGQWPWPRDILAELVTRLGDLGAAVIVLDILFPEADRLSPGRAADVLARHGIVLDDRTVAALDSFDNDRHFAEAIRDRNVVLGTALAARGKVATVPKTGFVEIGDTPSQSLPVARATTPVLPVLYDAAAGVGTVSVSPLGDQTLIRSAPLVWQTASGLMPALSVEALRLATGTTTLQLESPPDLGGVSGTLRIGEFEVPVSPTGEIWVRYRHEDPSRYIPAHLVLEGGDRDRLAPIAGSIVFVGTSAAGLLDLRTTALGETVPGVAIHAQIVEQIILGNSLRRDGVVQGFEVIAFCGLGLIVVLVIAFAGAIASMAAGFIAAMLFLVASWVLFQSYGILFDATFPFIGGFLAFSGMTAYQFLVADRDKRLIRKSFSHYVSPEVLTAIERQGHRLTLGGMTLPVTVMFADIRNFTPLSEGLAPSDLVSLLNQLFSRLGDEVLRERGTIDKFIGDAVMAFWNAPLAVPRHAESAARAALGMRRTLDAFNRSSGLPAVSVAIGLASGPALVGNIGSRDRFNYSVVGDTVNRASRIETSCRHVSYDIVISEETAAAAPDLAILHAGTLALKGVSERLPAAILVGDEKLAATPAFVELRRLHETLLSDLAEKGVETEARLARCIAAAEAVEPGLAGFYARILARAGDFTGRSGR